MSLFKKRVYSASRSKHSKRMENLDDADVLALNTRNEDCTFINTNKTSPLIVCDGVGSSKNARCASQKLTYMLCSVKFSEVSNTFLSDLIKNFYREIRCDDASTTCLAVWPQIKNSELNLKIFQLGDCFGYVTLFQGKKAEIHNLCTAPVNQVGINYPKHKNSDVQCLYEIKKLEDTEYCMNIPVQVYKSAAREKSLYFTPGIKTPNHEPCTLTTAIKKGLFLHELKFPLIDVTSFDIVLGSDGIHDNICMTQLFDTLSSNTKNKAMELFDRSLVSMNSDMDGSFDAVELVERILDEIPTSVNNALVDLYEISSTTSPECAYNTHPTLFKKVHEYLNRYHIYFGNLVCAFRILVSDYSEMDFSRQKVVDKLFQTIAFYDFILKNINVSKIDDLSVIQATFSKN